MSAPRRERILVLGGGGFIGANLCNVLVPVAARVEAYGRSVAVPGSLSPDVAWTGADLNDPQALSAAVARSDVIVHLASGATPRSADAEPASDVQASLISALALLGLCRGSRVRLMMFVSSGGTVYGTPDRVPITESQVPRPTSIYGIHKLTIERYLAYHERAHGMRHLTFRLANPYGPFQTARKGQGIVAAMIRRALAGEPLEIYGDGSVVRDYVYIDDVAAALMLGLRYEGEHRTFNVGAGRGLSVRQVADDIETMLGRGPLPRVFRTAQAVDLPINVLDIGLIRRELGWSPQVPWSDGLARTIAWMEKA